MLRKFDLRVGDTIDVTSLESGCTYAATSHVEMTIMMWFSGAQPVFCGDYYYKMHRYFLFRYYLHEGIHFVEVFVSAGTFDTPDTETDL